MATNGHTATVITREFYCCRVLWLMVGSDSHYPLHFLVSGPLPGCANRHCVKTLAKAGARLAVVKHDTAGELLAGRFLEFAQAAEIRGRNRCRRLDLDSCNSARASFDDYIYLNTVLIPEVTEVRRLILRGCLPTPLRRAPGASEH